MTAVRRHKWWLIASLTVIAPALLVIGGLGLWDYLRSTSFGAAEPGDQIVTVTTDRPSEKRPPADQPYNVPADQPRSIRLPSLGVEAYIQRVGIDQYGAVAAPNNIFFAGWYIDSPVPGDPGLSIIDGHAGGRYEAGVFRYLGTLATGDRGQIEMGDHSLREFTVTSVATYPVTKASAALFADDMAIQRELHIITCDGTFDDQRQTYDKRTIVVAQFDQPSD